jgi:hypothetical protein
VSISPPFEVIRRRYLRYAVVFVNVYVLVVNRSANCWFVRESTVVHVAPSFEPWSCQLRGSRSGTSFADVMVYETMTRDVLPANA